MKKAGRRSSLGAFFKDQLPSNNSNEESNHDKDLGVFFKEQKNSTEDESLQKDLFLNSPISNTSYAWSLHENKSLADNNSVYLDADSKSKKHPPERVVRRGRRPERNSSALESLFLDPFEEQKSSSKHVELDEKRKRKSTVKKKKKKSASY